MASHNQQNTEEVVVSRKALQLAKGWVKNMTGGADSYLDDDDIGSNIEIRPPRLGLGAKYLPHSQVTGIMNPVGKKLWSKLGSASKLECLTSGNKIGGLVGGCNDSKLTENESEVESEDDEENDDSRTFSFRKKQKSNAFDSHLIQGRNTKGKKKRKLALNS
eukprot:c28360_g4_i1 orf=299-784(+)